MWRLVKEALIRGLGILWLILLLFLILEVVVQLAIALAEPVVKPLLPGDVLESVSGAIVGWVSFFLIVLILGLVATTRFGTWIGQAIGFVVEEIDNERVAVLESWVPAHDGRQHQDHAAQPGP